MKQKRLILFSWALVFAVAVMIFWFSSQNGEDSMRTSGGVVALILRLFVPGFDAMTYRERMAFYERLQYLVRKGAHFTEFAMLGASLRLLFHVLVLRRPMLWAWVFGALYACTDELHQLILGTRTAGWTDVCIDSAGGLTGTLAVTLLLWLCGQKRRRTCKNTER